MRRAADELDFERAALLRDQVQQLEKDALLAGFEAPAKQGSETVPARRKSGRGGRGRKL